MDENDEMYEDTSWQFLTFVSDNMASTVADGTGASAPFPLSPEGLGASAPAPFDDVINGFEDVSNRCEQLLQDSKHHVSYMNGVLSEDPSFHAHYHGKSSSTARVWRNGRWCARGERAYSQAFLHTVKGVPRHGLLIDPGAARGLTGAQTRKEYEEQVLKHTQYAITYKKIIRYIIRY